jgi:hypothetical protein
LGVALTPLGKLSIRLALLGRLKMGAHILRSFSLTSFPLTEDSFFRIFSPLKSESLSLSSRVATNAFSLKNWRNKPAVVNKAGIALGRFKEVDIRLERRNMR